MHLSLSLSLSHPHESTTHMQKWVLFDILHVGDNPKKREAKCTSTCYKLPVSSLNITKKPTNFRLPNPVNPLA
jgi:hypothetical protein